jgi:hypothetical protein
MKVKIICLHGIGYTEKDFATKCKNILVSKDNVFKNIEFELAYWDDISQKIEEYYNIKDNINKIKSFLTSFIPIVDKIAEFLGNSILDLYLFFDDTEFWHLTEKRLINLFRENIYTKQKDKNIVLCILTHSLGTVIGYTILNKLIRSPLLLPRNINFDYFLTFATPLGSSYIQRRVKAILNNKPGLAKTGFSPKKPLIVKNWINFKNIKDPICSNSALPLIDLPILNWELSERDNKGNPRFTENIVLDFAKDPHSLWQYLSQEVVIAKLKEICTQPLS